MGDVAAEQPNLAG